MRPLLILFALLAGMNLNAQQFKQISKLKLSETIAVTQAQWVNLNGDTLLDVVLAGRTPTGEVKIFILENQEGQHLVEHSKFTSGILDGNFLIADHNKDNQMDLIIYGRTGSQGVIKPFLSSGAFTFTPSTNLLSAHAQQVLMTDLNQDGQAELITTELEADTAHLRIYEKKNNQYQLQFDTTGLVVTDFKLFDLNNDGLPDLVLSGRNDANQPILQQWVNQGKLNFKKVALSTPVAGKLSLLDFNADGYFDLWVQGLDEMGSPVKARWNNVNGLLEFESKVEDVMPVQIFSGDMNADGLADQWIFGKSGLDKVNRILTATDTIELDTAGMVLLEPGDFDRDGNLDFLQVLDSTDGTWIKLFKNTLLLKNERPKPASNSFAISTFNRTFLYWWPAVDDSTASASLTYDVWLGKDTESVLMSEFSLTNGRRAVVTHGSASANTFQVVNSLTDDRYYYQIQTVDSGYNGSYEICSGGVLPCFDLVHETVQACKGNEVALKSDEPAYWFSLSKGYLGYSDTFSFVATTADTLFSFVPQGSDCSKNKVWLIEINDGNTTLHKTIYACLQATVKLGIPPGWNSIAWDTEPAIADKDTISVVLTKEQTIHVEAHAFGCSLSGTFELKISAPELTVNEERFRIQRGNSVQLHITSNATTFQWSPGSGLSDATVAMPIAGPLQTTFYTITVFDSLGCTASGNVLVEVQQTGFIPNLFTPNNDGANDVLLVYGLTQATTFQFRIFNREGSVVYQTNNVTDALAYGWNGKTNGQEQPAGMYYWRVDGKLPDGNEILLNGSTSGSLLLMR
ncbi:MAG: gliding motility-associated C-terminal domain-containing protein [Cytophagales bacterium]|nr:gliding motility-associated C-terminal domain-containing protein [Cytophagales bacterium]